jgi:hypothetical protein
MRGSKNVKNITVFCKLRKSAVETPVSLSVVNGDEVFKNLVCLTGTTDFNSLELLENKEHSSRPVVLRSNENVATFSI